jgi:signal transduction histidine kinase
MVASRIVKEHGGSLALHSREGEGTTVEIVLPRDAPVPG